MKWSYDKEKPWLSGMMKKRCTRLYVKVSPGGGVGNLYYGKNGKWSPHRSEAKLFTQEDVNYASGWKLPNERWELVHD